MWVGFLIERPEIGRIMRHKVAERIDHEIYVTAGRVIWYIESPDIATIRSHSLVS